MVLATVALLLAAILCAAAYATRKLRRTRRPGEPPLVAGHLLWGGGRDFNEDAVGYLQKCTAEFGDVFTIRLLNYWMTVITDPLSYESFCHEKNFDFEPIQEHVNGKIFGFTVPNYPQMRKFVGKTTKGAAVSRNLSSFSDNLELALERLSADQQSGEWTREGLKALTSKTMFQAIFNTVFGQDKETAEFNYKNFWENMDTFHKYFNYIWIGLPHFLFPKAVRAIEKLVVQPSCAELIKSPLTSEYLKAAAEYMLSYNKSENDIKVHNVVYLHINANTFKISFWCLYNLLSDKDALAAVKAEIDEATRAKAEEPDSGCVRISGHELDQLKTLDSVVNETFRLASGVFMVRHNRKDTRFTVASTGKTYLVREGDKVCMYPPAIHKDPKIFEDPMAFKYDRFLDRKFYKDGIEVKSPLLPFGSLCPGRKIALLQTKWFILTMLTRYEMELLPGERAELDVQYHGHEIIPPKSDVQIKYRPLANSRSVALTEQ